MQVQVSLTLEIGASASITEMEQRIQEAGQQGMREALKQAIRQREDQQVSCPHCGRKQRRLEGTTRRVIATVFGRVEVARRRFRCQGRWHRWCPANQLWSRAEGRNHQPAFTRSGSAGRMLLAVSGGKSALEETEWGTHQCGRDPSAHQSARQATGGTAASGGRAGLHSRSGSSPSGRERAAAEA